MIPKQSESTEIVDVEKIVNDYSIAIGICFENSDWEKLSMVLTDRHTYLERILSKSISEKDRQFLSGLVEEIMLQDKDAVAKIQLYKARLVENQSILEQGQKAIKAYRTQ